MLNQLIKKSTLILTILFQGILFSQNTVHSQILAISGNHREMATQLSKALQWQQENLERRLRIQLADLDAACSLSPKQKKQLEIAIKGTVSSCMKTANERVVEAANDLGLKFDPEQPDEWEAVGDSVSAHMRPDFYFGAEDYKFWNSALEKAISDEQAEQWKAWNDRRREAQKELAIGRFLVTVDQQLRLSKKQREQLEQVIGEHYGDLFLKNLNKRVEGTVDFSKAVTANENEKHYQLVAEIFSEDQLQVWSSVFVPVLRSLR